VLLALAIGLAAGLLARGATSAESKPASARRQPAVVVSQGRRPVAPEAESRREPDASAAPAQSNAAADMSRAMAAVQAYAEEQSGAQVGAALTPLDGSVATAFAGTVAGGRPWSTMKVPTAAAYLNFKREAAGAASGEETIPTGTTPREDLGNALVNSDNLAIRHRIQEMIGSLQASGAAGAINRMLEAGGARPQIQPVIDPSIDSLQIGTGEWTLVEAANWFRRLQVGAECLGLAPADRTFILKQLRAAPTALHWGAAAALDDSHIALKPGWGSDGSRYTVEQAVIVGNGEEDEAEGFPSLAGGYVMVLMAILPSSDPSAFPEGQGQLATLAKIIAEKMGTPGPGAGAAPPASC
jgi:hypothetical protein